MTARPASLPSKTEGYEVTRFNALKHGVLSHDTVLPWENESEYDALLDALIAEHQPQGPTDEHLVEELAGIIWRKRRLRLAEAAAHRRGLDSIAARRDTVAAALSHLTAGKPIERARDAIQATPTETGEDIRALDAAEAMIDQALKILRTGKADAYENALAALREDTRKWWEDELSCNPRELDEDEETATPDTAGLLRFLEKEVLPWYAQRRTELKNRPLIRAQAFGESLDPDKLERLSRYEVHLDRKLERTLAMLIRLRELRHTASPE
ncbi:MAG TPA: hypothetical protein VKB96_16710 [Gammaproteobacteria bacterium]|nr:hypothetical protein [Gammaproteobacteria bacterium]